MPKSHGLRHSEAVLAGLARRKAGRDKAMNIDRQRANGLIGKMCGHAQILRQDASRDVTTRSSSVIEVALADVCEAMAFLLDHQFNPAMTTPDTAHCGEK
jgi:hypothetical protein